MITVSFCCNHPDNGLPLGKVCAIQLHGDDVDIELESPWYPDAKMVMREDVLNPPGAKGRQKLLFPMPDRCDRTVKLGREWFGCYGWKGWYGNWCWDATRMPAVEARRMLLMLRELGWRCVASECEFGEAYTLGLELTPEMLTFALSDQPSPVEAAK